MINKIKKIFCKLNIDFVLLLSISLMPIFLCFNRCFNFTINTFVIPFYVITLLVLILNIKKILKLPKKILILFLLFFISSIISVLISEVKVNSVFGTWNLYGVMGYLSFASIFFSAIFLKKDEFFKLFKINALIGFVLSIISFINLQFNLNLFLINNGFNGPFYHFNHFAIYLLISCLCSIFMIFYKNKIVWYVTTLVLIYAIIYNNTFGVYLALLFAIILIFVRYFKTDKIKVFYLLLLFILLSVVVNNTTVFMNNHSVEKRAISNNFNVLKKDVKTVKDNAKNLKSDIKNDTKTSFDEIGTRRGELWRKSIQYWLINPVFGLGINNLTYYSFRDMGKQIKPHNFILEILTADGIIGLVLVMSILVIILFYSFRRFFKLDYIEFYSFVICVSYLFSAFFANSMLYYSPYFFIFLGFVAKKYINSKINKRDVDIVG